MQQKLLGKLRRLHIQDWINFVVKRFKEQAWNQKQILYFSISGTVPLVAFDRSSLELILIGLLNNACKHTAPRAEITVAICTKLRISCSDSAQFAQEPEQLLLQMQVSYYGAETPASELLQVLDQFYPTNHLDPSQESKTNLGLVKRLVDQLGGAILIESTSSQTCFTVEVPQSS